MRTKFSAIQIKISIVLAAAASTIDETVARTSDEPSPFQVPQSHRNPRLIFSSKSQLLLQIVEASSTLPCIR